jgi:CHAD domain-containing protein
MIDFPAEPLSPAAKGTLEQALSAPSRAYRLKRKEPVSEGVRRIAAGRLDNAIEQLRERQEGRAKAIHETRKDLKKTRSLLRLVRDGLGDKRYRAENDRLRHAGRLLSDARDADVKVGAIADVVDRYRDELEPTERAALDGEVERLRRDLPRPGDEEVERSIESAIEAIEQARAEVGGWDPAAADWQLIEPGLKRAYARGQERMREARKNPSDEAVHEWRKRSKDLWYHARLVRRAWPAVLDETVDQAHELSDLLGDYHDLSVVASDLRGRQEANGGGAHARVAELVGCRQRELLDGAISLGRRLYAEKPKPYTRRIGVYFNAWRG